MLHLCTYFDHSYLVRGVALHASLMRQRQDFTLWILCLSDECFDALEKLELLNVRTIRLESLESADPQLTACRQNRSLFEYFMTCSPCLPRYLFESEPGIEVIHYVDADFYFFSDPQPVVDAFDRYSIGITPHRFPPALHRKLSRCGIYNVGWMSFRRDEAGLACLDWWRDRCIEWCCARVERDRYADQKYLDEFPKRFERVLSIEHKGMNLAPWNVANYEVERLPHGVSVDADRLICFHFSSIQKLGGGWYRNNLRVFSRLTAEVRRLIYIPYLKELEVIEAQLAEKGLYYPALSGAMKMGSLRETLRGVRDIAGLARSVAHGNFIRL